MARCFLVCSSALRFTTISQNFFLVKPIANFSGHSIDPYKIHAGKSVMLVKNDDQTKMEEGEYFAIETFGSTGRGYAVESVCCQTRCYITFSTDSVLGRLLALRENFRCTKSPFTVSRHLRIGSFPLTHGVD
jgi:methionine aminopeptidase